MINKIASNFIEKNYNFVALFDKHHEITSFFSRSEYPFTHKIESDIRDDLKTYTTSTQND